MTKTRTHTSKGEFDAQYPPDHTAKLLTDAANNMTLMLQAADLLRELGYDNMAIALHACSEMTSAAIAKAVSPDLRKPIVIEVRGGVVQNVLNVPSGIEYEIRDYDNSEETRTV